jgi:hypothetical protein
MIRNDFRNLALRVLGPALIAGGLYYYYLVAYDARSYSYAADHALQIAVLPATVFVPRYIRITLRVLIIVPALMGALYYLIAHYAFSYPHAARIGLGITVMAAALLAVMYFFQWIAGEPFVRW